jgi:hypothetical protein
MDLRMEEERMSEERGRRGIVGRWPAWWWGRLLIFGNAIRN